MNNNENETLDKWEQNLEEELEKLKKCQEEKAVLGCSECDVFLNCQIRKGYVKAVYESMNKGQGGGFEF